MSLAVLAGRSHAQLSTRAGGHATLHVPSDTVILADCALVDRMGARRVDASHTSRILRVASCRAIEEALLTTCTLPVACHNWKRRERLSCPIGVDRSRLKAKLLANYIRRLIVVPHVVTTDRAPLHIVGV